MRTRKSNSSSNYISTDASQEYYENTYNFVGILCFSGMNLTNKVITGISFTIKHAIYSMPFYLLNTIWSGISCLFWILRQ